MKANPRPAGPAGAGDPSGSASEMKSEDASPLDHLHELIAQVQQLRDPVARQLIQECLQSLLQLYGEGLARVLELTEAGGATDRSVRDALLQDRLIRVLLLIHGLHPESLESRLQAALAKVRPYLQSHGGDVALASLHDDVARLRFSGACKSCPSSAITMELAIRRAVEELCPDLLGIELEEIAPAAAPMRHGTES